MRDLILTVRQPWASLIAHGLKDVENRRWATPHRGRLLVHAASRSCPRGMAEWGCLLDEWPIGGVVGTCDLVDCTRDPRGEWHEDGMVAWVLRRAEVLPFTPLPPWRLGMPSRLRLWRLEPGTRS